MPGKKRGGGQSPDAVMGNIGKVKNIPQGGGENADRCG